MKKVQRSFAVEYKSGRRKSGQNSNSIWDNVDLTSFTRDVEADAMPLVSTARTHTVFNTPDIAATAHVVKPSLTASVDQLITGSVNEGKDMADEITTIIDTDVPVLGEAPVAEKKQRKPRAKKITPDETVSDAAALKATGMADKQKRGRKPKSAASAAPVKARGVKQALKVEQTPPTAPSAIVEMADLLELEEENAKLRKLLAEKLRAENADLRKKLNLG